MTSTRLLLLAVLALALPAGGLTAAPRESISNDTSPRLLRLTEELRAKGSQALAEFWREVGDKAPLEESVAGDKKRVRITFLWRGDAKTARVSVFGGLPGPNLAKPLRHLADTDVWHLSEVHSTEARFQYVFQVNGPESISWKWSEMMKTIEQTPPQPDPLNSRSYAGWSFVELADAPAQRWINKQAVPSGHIAKSKMKSEILNTEYSLNIYTPPNYEKDGRRCWLAVAFDGGFLNMQPTLDNLLAAGRIPPIVVVGIKNTNRERDLGCSDEFARFLATELVPWARKSYRVYDDSRHTIVGGTSLGGKMAAWCGLKHSEVFGKVLSQSGSFQTGAHDESAVDMWSGEAPKMVASEFLLSPRLPVEFYLEVGRYETTLPFSPLMEARRLRDVLQAKGYRVTYSEFVGGHNEVCWRGSLAEALMALTVER